VIMPMSANAPFEALKDSFVRSLGTTKEYQPRSTPTQTTTKAV
jgi:hypothetical protein